MHYRIPVCAVIVTALLQGCATMSKDECLVSDWRTIGYEDGVQGRTADRIGQHRKACAAHGVAADLEEYQTGRAAGLNEFCKPANGFAVGSKGGAYHGVCPSDMEDEFVASYRKGKQLHDLEAGVQTTTSQINSKRRRLEQIDDELMTDATRVITEVTTPTERAQLLANAKKLAEERGRLQAEIPELVKRKALLEDELTDYKAQLAAND